MAPKRLATSTASKVVSSSALSSGQQPKLIASSSSLSQSTMVKDLQGIMRDVILQIRGEMKETLEENNKTLSQEIAVTLKGVASVLEKLNFHVEKVLEKVELMEEKFESMEKELENFQDEILMLQYKQMENALRIRGLHESVQGNLREMVAKDFAVILNREEEEVLSGIDQTFRVNSVVAEQKNLPRDVVIYFGKRSLRNEILQAFYKKRFQIASQDIIILKEIPPKILRRRKEFAFLANELKKRQILFRWDVPTGMVVSYLGTRYSLNTVSKAKDFYTSVLGVSSSSSIMFEALEEEKAELQSEVFRNMKIGKFQSEEPQQAEIGKFQSEGPQQVEMEEQKIICPIYNCKDKDQHKKEVPQALVSESAGEVGFINSLEQSSIPELQSEQSILIENGRPQQGEMELMRPQQVEMEEQKTCATYNCKDQQKKFKEVPQEMKDQKIICPINKRTDKEAEEVLQVLVPETSATYKCKEKVIYKCKERDQQKKEVEEPPQVPISDLEAQLRFISSLERPSRADYHAFFSLLAGKRVR